MQTYELTFIVGEDLTQDKAEAVMHDTKKLLESKGATVIDEFFWGKRKLTYQINKNIFGYYCILVFSAENTLVNTLTQEFNITRRFLRYLITIFHDATFFEEQRSG